MFFQVIGDCNQFIYELTHTKQRLQFDDFDMFYFDCDSVKFNKEFGHEVTFGN